MTAQDVQAWWLALQALRKISVTACICGESGGTTCCPACCAKDALDRIEGREEAEAGSLAAAMIETGARFVPCTP
jgi:hypothetical protein